MPKFGEQHLNRYCGRRLGHKEDGSEEICAKEPVIHIAWEDTEDIHAGWACKEHKYEVLCRWHPFQYHAVGPCCGMPGSLWFVDENLCGYEDGLPTAEPARQAKVLV